MHNKLWCIRRLFVMKPLKILLLLCAFGGFESHAYTLADSLNVVKEKTHSGKPIHIIGFDIKPSYVFPTHDFLEEPIILRKR